MWLNERKGASRVRNQQQRGGTEGGEEGHDEIKCMMVGVSKASEAALASILYS